MMLRLVVPNATEGEVDLPIKESPSMSLAVLTKVLENNDARTEDELGISANEPPPSSREHNEFRKYKDLFEVVVVEEIRAYFPGDENTEDVEPVEPVVVIEDNKTKHENEETRTEDKENPGHKLEDIEEDEEGSNHRERNTKVKEKVEIVEIVHEQNENEIENRDFTGNEIKVGNGSIRGSLDHQNDNIKSNICFCYQVEDPAGG